MMINLFKKNSLRWSLLGIGVLVLIGGMALTNAQGDTPDPGALGKAVSHEIDLGYGQLQNLLVSHEIDLGYGQLQILFPADWEVQDEHTTGEVKFTVGEKDRGGVRIVGFYRDQPGGGWRPNHSRAITEEDVSTPIGKGELVTFERSHPAASGNNDTWQEIHAVIPLENKDLAYEFWLKVEQSVEQDTLLLKQLLSEVKPIDEQGIEAEGDEAAIAKLVEDFGRKLQTVSLHGPQDIVNKSMQENYGDFVSPTLIAEWVNDPLNAPGRRLSSPWPDRIEILTIERLAEDAYEVKGEIMEMTSVEKLSGGVAAKRPITLGIKKIGGRWLIDAATLGAYEEPNSIVYKNTQYGFSFSLPVSWKGYSLVTGKWEGLAIGGDQIVETGPMISIRHPQWTAQNPRQDIPIMVFTLAQWNSLEQEKFHIGAAPIGPKELGRNSRYVFALPARYNFAFPTGFEEVEEILARSPLQGDDIVDE